MPVNDAAGVEAWRPTAPAAALRARAALLARIRAFFDRRGVLEVETPILSRGAVPAPYLDSFRTEDRAREFYLQTSPEFAMKRLLAAGSGPIFQICKAFRRGEAGRLHNPEFTLLEWYRPGYDHRRLMIETEELLREVLDAGPVPRLTYAEAFLSTVGLDPHRAPTRALREWAAARGAEVIGLDDEDRDAWLDLLLDGHVLPNLEVGRAFFLTDYPASQAALARIRPGPPAVAERFELFVDGIELANGFHELADASEQRRRFDRELQERRRRGLPEVPLDGRFLAALSHGLPNCAGVALGIDRLLMLASGAEHLNRVLAFPLDRA
jgi:lysyl-tRNA synthetase class 2